MHLPGEEGHNPLKRSFSDITDGHGAAADQEGPKRFSPRRSAFPINLFVFVFITILAKALWVPEKFRF